MHYYEYFQWLCRSANVDDVAAYKGCNLNRSSYSRWKSAYSEGREIKMSAKAAQGIADFFHIPVGNVLMMEDAYGLSVEDWKAMGFAYSGYRASLGASVEYVAVSSEIHESRIIAFEKEGITLSKQELIILCGVLNGATLEDVFHGYAMYFDGKEDANLKGQTNNQDCVQAAFFGGYADDLTTDEREGLWKDAQDFARFRAEQIRKEKKSKNG